MSIWYRLCGPVVRVPGYRSRGPGFHSRRYQIFLRSSGSGTGLTQPREDNWGATWKESSGSGLEKTEINGRGGSLRCPCDTLYPPKLALSSPTKGGRSAGIVRWRTKDLEFYTPIWYTRLSEHDFTSFQGNQLPSHYTEVSFFGINDNGWDLLFMKVLVWSQTEPSILN
jgi:hypothetical protein